MRQIVILISLSFITVFAHAQLFKAGDRIEAEINMSGSPEYQKWKKATITKILMWNGQVSGYSIKTDEGAELVLADRFIRKLIEKQEDPEIQSIDNNTKAVVEFKVGDRVEVDKIMAKDPKDSKWGKGTVRAVDHANQRYVVRLDENFIDISILMRPGTDWIRLLNDGSITPDQASCPFNEPPGVTSKNAQASAPLFKRVIYEWQNSVKRGTRLGITFEKFEMGKSFKNIITARGRLLDFVPTNAIVFPVKTKQVICEEYATLIRRTLYEVEYACFKNEFDEWVCKNGAPTKLEINSIYKD